MACNRGVGIRIALLTVNREARVYVPDGQQTHRPARPLGLARTVTACCRTAAAKLAQEPLRLVTISPYTYVELASVLAQGGVVLLDEVPADLILGVRGGRRGLRGLGSVGRVVGRLGIGRSSAILLLVHSVSVCCHLDLCACNCVECLLSLW